MRGMKLNLTTAAKIIEFKIMQQNNTPRILSRKQAADYLGICESFFDKQITLGAYPAPVSMGVRKLWDKHQLDTAIDRLFADTEIQVEEIVLQ